MDTTRAEQITLDDALVAPANQLKIGKSNLRLSSDLKSKEATLQVVYDVLKLTPFYKAFQIIADQFEELPFEEEILKFLRDLGHSGEIKVIIDVNVNKLHQTWRSFAAVISKCLSGKSTGYDSLRLSQAQILWDMYHKKNVDFAYLLWEDFVYQVENKNVKRSNEMYYPRFTKVIINFFMNKDQSIPRRNKINWHFARDDHMFTMIKVVSRHEDTQLYGAILPHELTNEDIKNSKSYKEYYTIASGAEPPKTKESVKKKQVGSDKTKTPPTTKGKRLKTSAKAAKHAKKKQPAKTSKAKGLTVLSKVALTKAEQMKLATKRSMIETHSSHASGSGADEGTEDDDDEVNVSEDDDDDDNDDDVDKDDDDADVDGQDDEDQDDVNEQTDSDNDGDDFVHPKFSTQDQEATHNEEESDEEVQGVRYGRRLADAATPEEMKRLEFIRDVNLILEGKRPEMTDASLYCSRNSNTRIDSILTLNTKATSLVDVSLTTIDEPPLLSATTLPTPPTPLITHLQQTPVPTLETVSSSSLQDLPNFGSLFGFDHRLKTLETDFFEFKQTN
ncbi:uncharacterized mitochondrial protein-like protein [Tanacetum coccineum]